MEWHGHSWGPNDSISGVFDGDFVPFSGFGTMTIVRTIATVHVSYGNEDLPPAAAGNAIGNLHLRVLSIPDGDGIPSGWPEDPDCGTDDILIAPINWTVGQAVPAGFTTGSTSNMFYHGSLSGGLVDVKSERLFEFGVHARTFASVGPLLSTGRGPGLDLFTAQIMVRQLISVR